MLWGNGKAVALANLCPDTLDEAQAAALTGLERVGSRYELRFAFLDHTGLFPDQDHPDTKRSLVGCLLVFRLCFRGILPRGMRWLALFRDI
ncbi:hypothetical protein A8926_3993 [Saccharopolyspora spinosa]|uniref:Uncharacterized protein n=1 Tax=Saccharopolyspora spinosa TaxID=60894 RepID=A0A2N3XZU0_SACSN|nr:hypothetical protein A8926_3993 [Saccharopolyspora spinosa]